MRTLPSFILYNFNMNFGEIFKENRISFGYTQKQLADILKIHQSNISDWERNISRPEYEHLIALAKLYDISLEELLGTNK